MIMEESEDQKTVDAVVIPPSFIARGARVRTMQEYKKLYRSSIKHGDAFWKKQAELLDWFKPHTSLMEGSLEEGNTSWFVGGALNACYNCVDRHALRTPNKVAIIAEVYVSLCCICCVLFCENLVSLVLVSGRRAHCCESNYLQVRHLFALFLHTCSERTPRRK